VEDLSVVFNSEMPRQKQSMCVLCVNRYSHTSAVYKDYLILIGGVSLSCLTPPVEIVDLKTGHSETVALPVSAWLLFQY